MADGRCRCPQAFADYCTRSMSKALGVVEAQAQHRQNFFIPSRDLEGLLYPRQPQHLRSSLLPSAHHCAVRAVTCCDTERQFAISLSMPIWRVKVDLDHYLLDTVAMSHVDMHMPATTDAQQHTCTSMYGQASQTSIWLCTPRIRAQLVEF